MAAESESITRFENSLTEYLISLQSSQFADVMSFSYRYNNLKIFMSPTKIREPHFFVRLGISEACFSIETGNKLDGSLGPEDRMVVKWANRVNIHRELETYWKEITEERKSRDSALAESPIPISDNGISSVDMTSTGLSKQKQIIAREKRKKLLKFKKKKTLN